MNSKEEELEFISVTNDDDDDGNMTHSYGIATNDSSGSGNVIGNWILNQSKVSFR
jgi:hypothetical protein